MLLHGLLLMENSGIGNYYIRTGTCHGVPFWKYLAYCVTLFSTYGMPCRSVSMFTLLKEGEVSISVLIGCTTRCQESLHWQTVNDLTARLYLRALARACATLQRLVRRTPSLFLPSFRYYTLAAPHAGVPA